MLLSAAFFLAQTTAAAPASPQTVPGAPAQLAVEGPRWDFETPGDIGWSGVHDVRELRIERGALVVEGTGPDPYIAIGDLYVDVEKTPFLAVRMRCNVDGVTQVFVQTAARPGYSAERMLGLPARASADFAEQEIDLRTLSGVEGRVTGVRIDPANGWAATRLRAEIDSIRFYQKPARVEVDPPCWTFDGDLAITVRNAGGEQCAAAVELRRASRILATLPALAGGEEKSVKLERDVLKEAGWLEAASGSQVFWRGRVNAPQRTGATTAIASGEVELRALGNAAELRAGSHRVRIAPLASATVRSTPDAAPAYIEFSLTADAAHPERLAEELHDAELGKLSCSLAWTGLHWVATLRTERALLIERFEGPRLLEGAGRTHALLPGVEYLEPDERSAETVWTGPWFAGRRLPDPRAVSAHVAMLEYGRDRGDPWVAALLWPSFQHHASVELVSDPARPSFATLRAPAPALPYGELATGTPPPIALAAGAELRLEGEFRVESGKLEDVYARWTAAALRDTHATTGAVTLTPVRIEAIRKLCLQAYRGILADPAGNGWKVAFGAGAPRMRDREVRSLIHSEAVRTGADPAGFGLRRGDQIEAEQGPIESIASSTTDTTRLREELASGELAGYVCTPAMRAAVRKFTGDYGFGYDSLGAEGECNSGVLAVRLEPLVRQAALAHEPEFIAAARFGLAQLSAFTVPRGAQTFEVDVHAPDILASANALACNLWGWRMGGDERYLDEAVRWARTGLPFIYTRDDFALERIDHVQVMGFDHESSEVLRRKADDYYAPIDRELGRFASLPCFGTSWYVMPWYASPVAWCGLEWARQVLDLHAIRPVPELAQIAREVVAWASMTQSDRGPLAGTLPDSIDLTDAAARQPFIAPDLLLRCLMRLSGDVDHGEVLAVPLAVPPWTHVASRATVCVLDVNGGRLAVSVSFRPDQEISLLVGSAKQPAHVRVNGEELQRGEITNTWHWWPRPDGGGAAVIIMRGVRGDYLVQIDA